MVWLLREMFGISWHGSKTYRMDSKVSPKVG